MSGTEEFGNGGYGTGEFDRTGAEAGPGTGARSTPPAGPRVQVPGAGHQGPAAAGGPGGAGAGAPWLAAGSVPYAEAVFGAAGQGEGRPGATGQRPAAAGRRGVPDAQQRPGAGAAGTQVPPQRAQQGPGEAGFGGEAYGEGYVNGYGSRAGGVAQVPQQRFDASPFDSGFTQQGRRFDPREQSRAGGYEPAGAPQQGQPGASPEQAGYDAAGTGSGFERTGFESGGYEASVPPPGFDAPTTEFRPGPMFDEPTVRPGAAQPGAGASGGGLNGRGPAFGARPAAVNGAAQAAGAGAGAATTQRPSMSGPGTWTAAPPTHTPPQGTPIQQAPPAQQAQQGSSSPEGAAQEPAQPGPSPTGTGQVPVGQPSVSGIPRVPSSAAAGPRPAVPDEPLPAPPPLPTRPPRAERQAQQAAAQAQAQVAQSQAAQAQAGGQGSGTGVQQPSAATARRETLTPPRRPIIGTQQPPQQQPDAEAPQQQAAAQPGQAAAGGRRGQEQSADDLSSERLRSVAPVPPQRAVAGESPAAPAPAGPAASGAAARPARSGSFDALADTGEHGGEEAADELIVPWQAVPGDEGDVDEDATMVVPDDIVLPQPAAPSGTGQAPVAQPRPQGTATTQGAVTTQGTAAPHPVGTAADAEGQGVRAATPSRAEAAAARVRSQAAQQAQAGPARGSTGQAGAAPSNPAQSSPAQASTGQVGTGQVGVGQAPADTGAHVQQAPAAEPGLAAGMPTPRGTRRRVAEPAQAPAQTPANAQAPAAAPANTAPANAAQVAANAAASAQPAPAQPAPAPVQSVSAQAASAASKQQAHGAPAARPAASPAPTPAPAPAAPAPATQPARAAAAPAAPTGEPHPADEGHRAPAYEDDALAAVYRVIHERRDVRNDFLSDEVPTETLTRILEAAHTAPSVGFSQPWDFLVIRDEAMRRTVHDLAVRQRRSYAASLPKARARAFAALKIEAILDTPVNIVVTCDPTRGGRHTLGRYSQPMMAPFSSCLAVENLWLAARAEGLGVGWVSFFDERELAAVLDLPSHLQVVAYLCVGYVKSFPQEPELAGAGWAKRRPLAWAVHEERFGRRALPGAQPISLLSETVDAIRGLDPEALAAARDRQLRMTKPPGSLGVLEAVSEQLAGLAGTCPPPLPEPAALAVFAADHGVHAQGVTPWPQEVTAQMVANFLAGGAVVNAFAKQVGAEVCVVDVGVNAELAPQTGLIPRKVRYGTGDMTQGPALTREEAVAALEAGIETARDLVAAGNRCLLTGDMGIANTTASAALIAAFTGASPAQVTGYGTGIDEQTYAHKVEVVRAALALHRPDPQDPVGVLAAFGGLEHAALAGFILGAAALRVPVVLDGVIAGAAALVAQALSPEVTVACVAGHRSAEPGHALALEALGIIPLIDLELRLGEGSGAALALPLVGAAVRALREVATFDDAGVADASDASVLPPTERDRA